MVSIKRIIAIVVLAILVLILVAVIFGPAEYTGKTTKTKENPTSTTIKTTSTVETTSTIKKVTTTTTTIMTVVQPLNIQTETNPDCEELGCPSGTMLVGNKNSKKYHNCDCTWAKKINSQNLICFRNIEEAQESGYIPCKVCKP